jgi:hypothetical protein
VPENPAIHDHDLLVHPGTQIHSHAERTQLADDFLDLFDRCGSYLPRGAHDDSHGNTAREGTAQSFDPAARPGVVANGEKITIEDFAFRRSSANAG